METVTAHPIVWSRETAPAEKRDVWTALKRGFRGRCPRCGEGKLFRAFLKVDDHCSCRPISSSSSSATSWCR